LPKKVIQPRIAASLLNLAALRASPSRALPAPRFAKSAEQNRARFPQSIRAMNHCKSGAFISPERGNRFSLSPGKGAGCEADVRLRAGFFISLHSWGSGRGAAPLQKSRFAIFPE
jgi:hypothetical protein